MSVIAFVGNKGGVGKTTLSINFSVGVLEHSSVTLIDADPQGSALQWRKMSETPNRLDVYNVESQLSQQTKQLQDSYKHVVIDCPPYVQSTQTAAVLQVADIAIIPVLPSPIDLWATVHIEKVAEEARKTNPGLDVILVINQLELRTTFSRLMRQALSEISFKVADTAIRRRAVYRNCALEGKSVFNIGRPGAAAAEEINELIKEVIV